MVIGNGLVARGFQQYNDITDFIIFASGVSNSKTSTLAEFQREHDLLIKTINDNVNKRFVYFSTCSIDDPDLQHTEYVKHKLAIEAVIQQLAPQYQVFRLSNLAGRSNNPNTVLNYFYSRIMCGEPFELWVNSERNVIDVEDVFKAADYVLKNRLFANTIINIANTSNYQVRYIVETMEAFCKRKAIYKETQRGSAYDINLTAIKPVYDALQLHFDDTYLKSLLKKYYP